MATQRMGDLLVEAGQITRAQLNDALRHQAHAGGRLGTNLVELGFIDEKTLATFLAKQLSIPSVTAAQIDRVTVGVLQLMNAQQAEKLRCVPVREDAGRLWVAMADPTDKNALSEIETAVKRPVRPMVAPELLIQYALEKHYKVRRKPRVVEVRTGESDLLHIEDSSRVAPAVRKKGPVPPPPPHRTYNPNAPPSKPAYAAHPVEMESVALDSVTGFLDEAPQLPTSTPTPTVFTLKNVVEELSNALTDETVLDIAARYLVQFVPRVWVFLLKKSELHAWGGRGMEPQLMAGIRVPLAELPIVAQALSSGEVVAGRIQPASLARLAQPMMVWGETLGYIVPIRIGKHAVGVIFCVDAALDAMRKTADVSKLAQKLDQALHINYLRRMLLQI